MKVSIALITGGYTAESEVSLKSAAFVFQQLDKSKYDVYTITVTKDSWFHVADNGIRYEINRDDFTLPIDDRIIRFDLAFIMLHGSPGEDGRLQGYFDMVGLPYTSCDALTSALTMNKAYTKAVLVGIPDLYLAKSIQLFESQRSEAVDTVKRELSIPYFVKPNAGGSSIGMTKVKAHLELHDAIEKAFNAENTGRQVLVEEFVDGREFSVGIYRKGNGLVVLPATEVITEREFFDYEAKYIAGQSTEITPADLTSDQRARVERLVKAIYTRLNCKGMVRIDFFLENGTDRFFFIEINTIPGQTAQSFIPQQIRAAGMTETEFYGGLIEQALVGDSLH
ncbi:D-alanine--D-alanine ligase [Parapedobacter pyrenivorans]|uniref:D-alanine--D-alanine ligase n=1 Tax=Parapedobacter pyrenivorans TaxID=1305674 RepID=A0A917HR29_9SPHI|nr:D-alanine--D-alanine ligase [Parapedobacter pyrenivorans]GGG86387.1 D-alanine--D-alanine ligase [Parapedobacter pyrenivorans]